MGIRIRVSLHATLVDDRGSAVVDGAATLTAFTRA
jgi:hypothetical protein